MSKPKSKTTVLLVEDDKIQQIAGLHILRECACEVDVAGSGQEAIAKVNEAKNYDIIFMDIGLGEMDGYAVTLKLREDGYEGPIVALTVHSDEETEKKCILSGMDAHLAKPLSLGKIKAVIAQFIV